MSELIKARGIVDEQRSSVCWEPEAVLHQLTWARRPGKRLRRHPVDSSNPSSTGRQDARRGGEGCPEEGFRHHRRAQEHQSFAQDHERSSQYHERSAPDSVRSQSPSALIRSSGNRDPRLRCRRFGGARASRLSFRTFPVVCSGPSRISLSRSGETGFAGRMRGRMPGLWACASRWSSLATRSCGARLPGSDLSSFFDFFTGDP